MRLIFVDESWEDYLFWQKTDKKMIKKLLLGAAILGIATPSFAQTQNPPTISVAVANVSSNIACRNKIRAKYFELGATRMADANSNTQWATINGMSALVWCRDTQAVINTAGSNYNSVYELRDEIFKIF